MFKSIDRLEAALSHLDTLIGLYVAPVLRERLAACDDQAEQALIVGLVKAYAAVYDARRDAFGFLGEWTLTPHQGDLEVELKELLDRERRWSETAGYQRGRCDEVAARMSEDGPLRLPPRPRTPVTVEPHRAPW